MPAGAMRNRTSSVSDSARHLDDPPDNDEGSAARAAFNCTLVKAHGADLAVVSPAAHCFEITLQTDPFFVADVRARSDPLATWALEPWFSTPTPIEFHVSSSLTVCIARTIKEVAYAIVGGNFWRPQAGVYMECNMFKKNNGVKKDFSFPVVHEDGTQTTVIGHGHKESAVRADVVLMLNNASQTAKVEGPFWDRKIHIRSK